MQEDIVAMRVEENLTIDELHDRFPQIPRSRIGRYCKGVKIDMQSRGNSQQIRENPSEIETNQHEILESDEKEPSKTTSTIEQKEDIPNPINETSQKPQVEPAGVERDASNNTMGASSSASQRQIEQPQMAYRVQNPVQMQSFNDFSYVPEDGNLVIPQRFLEDLESMFNTKSQSRIVKGWTQNLRVWNQNYRRDRNRDNGHGLALGSELDHALAESVRQRTKERLYQMSMGDGQQNKDESFKDKLLLQLMSERNKVQPKNSLKDALTSVIQLQSSQSKSNWEFFSNIQGQINALKPSGVSDPQVAVALKKMDMEMEKWKFDKEDGGKKWDAIAAIVTGAAAKLPEALAGIRGNPAGNPNSGGEFTRIKCQKCGCVFPVRTEDMQQMKDLTCSACHAVMKVPEEMKKKALAQMEEAKNEKSTVKD